MPRKRQFKPPKVSALRHYGDELARFRRAAGLTQKQLADLTHYTAGYVGMFECGLRVPQRDFTRRADAVLKTGGVLMRLLPLVEAETTPMPQFGTYVEYEAQAAEIRTYEPYLVPGLLQTEQYMRVIFGRERPALAPQAVESRLALRQTRQELLKRAQPPHTWVIIEEPVLMRPVGGPAVMREQCERFIEAAESPHITLQVLTLDAGLSVGMGRNFSILELPDGSHLVHVDQMFSERMHELHANYREDLDAVGHYLTMFDHLRAEALSEERSLALIVQRTKEWI